MEILYFWIEDFANLKNQGINLSSKYFIHCDISNKDNVKEGTIFIKKNPDYIENFFRKKNVRNATAIIGKNGAGKSSILQYIKSNFPEGVSTTVSNALVAYCMFDDTGKESTFITYPQSWNLQLIDETGSFTEQKYTEQDNFRFEAQLSEASYIYYTFHLVYNEDATEWAGLKNISTSALDIAEEFHVKL